MFTLKVDHRENKLKPYFDEHKVECQYENLEFGDFQILDSQGQIKLLFERKTLDDMLASIKDGRYKNQKARIFQAGFQPHQLYYIIEGKLTFIPSDKATQTILQSSVINTMIRDKVGCFQTSNQLETFQLICGVFQRICKDPAKYFEHSSPTEQVVVMSSNKDTPERLWKCVLCQVPGVSDKSAAALLEKWNCFQAMYTELSVLEPSERLKVLNEIKVNGRKINKNIVENILKMFF
jgi:ERCC4-type nuclease